MGPSSNEDTRQQCDVVKYSLLRMKLHVDNLSFISCVARTKRDYTASFGFIVNPSGTYEKKPAV